MIVATSIYESARAFLPDWIDGVNALDWPQIKVVVVNDGLKDFDKLKRRLRWPCVVVDAPAGSIIPAVRALMLNTCRQEIQSFSSFVMFVDCDDVPLRDSPLLHSRALDKNPVSFGDLIVMGAEPFHAMELGKIAHEDKIGPDDLLDLNVLGFSNVAVRGSVLPDETIIPDDVIAVDWWLFSSLLKGDAARYVGGPVAFYRQHEANTLGAGASNTEKSVLRRLDIARRHYNAIGRPDRVENIDRLVGDQSRLDRAVAMTYRPVAWFDDVTQWVTV